MCHSCSYLCIQNRHPSQPAAASPLCDLLSARIFHRQRGKHPEQPTHQQQREASQPIPFINSQISTRLRACTHTVWEMNTSIACVRVCVHARHVANSSALVPLYIILYCIDKRAHSTTLHAWLETVCSSVFYACRRRE